MADETVDGSKHINSSDHPTHRTSKKGYPIVAVGTVVDCSHCDETHEADYHDNDVGYDVPGGHKRWNHYRCPNTGYLFAAKDGSKLR